MEKQTNINNKKRENLLIENSKYSSYGLGNSKLRKLIILGKEGYYGI